MAKRGPKPIPIDWEQFDKLCYIQATLREIADWFDCSEDTIENRVKAEKGLKFSEYYDQKRSRGKVALRRRQHEVAMSGNVPMLIWLGKQHLGQKDKQEVTEISDLSQMTDEALDDLIKKEEQRRGKR